jgi:hypothetical protein
MALNKPSRYTPEWMRATLLNVFPVLRRLILLAAVLGLTPMAFAETGEIVKRISGCDYYLVDSPSGYSVLEWMGGHDPDRGDIIIGNFHSYGMRTFFVNDADTETRAWVEDYGLSRDHGMEKLIDLCE